jgi:hypothetical protein
MDKETRGASEICRTQDTISIMTWVVHDMGKVGGQDKVPGIISPEGRPWQPGL